MGAGLALVILIAVAAVMLARSERT